jgi:HAD superfamily phosphoserine phosphatase-like hydrolase
MRGEIAFEPALRERVKLLAGLSESVIADVLRDRITLNPGARTLARTMRARSAYVAIVSGGFRQFTAAVRDRIGADEDRANTLAIEGGKLTGEVIEPILGHNAKLVALKDIAARMGLALSDTLAVGTAPTIRDAASRRPRRRLPRQAEGRRRRPRANRPRRPYRPALRPGDPARGFCRAVNGVKRRSG